jgi:hypothetical protein
MRRLRIEVVFIHIVITLVREVVLTRSCRGSDRAFGPLRRIFFREDRYVVRGFLLRRWVIGVGLAHGISPVAQV